jgi:hypothetical protein
VRAGRYVYSRRDAGRQQMRGERYDIMDMYDAYEEREDDSSEERENPAWYLDPSDSNYAPFAMW